MTHECDVSYTATLTDANFGQDRSRADGILGKIFVWILLVSTADIIYLVVSAGHSKWLGKFVASIFGTT